MMLVGKRFLITMNATNVPMATVREVYSSIDAKKLAALK
jgi:hypothetical protein